MRAFSSLLLFTFSTLGAFAHAEPAVNFDDPNLAFTNDYVADTATDCPKTLKGKALRLCLAKNGFSLETASDLESAADLTENLSKTSRPSARTVR